MMLTQARRVLVLVLPMVAIAVGAFGSDAQAADTPDEYNFRWLDPDKKVYVLQNRKFEKANHLLLTAMVGPMGATPYRGSVNVSPRAAYYFKEWIGLELLFSYTFNWENPTFSALTSAVPGALPVTRETRLQYGAQLHLVPWYAKINVFNQILYFDWYFGVGAGASGIARDDRPNRDSPAVYTSETFFTTFLSTGHQYHLTRRLTVRFDFTAALYPAPAQGATGSLILIPNYTFGAGVGVRL